MKRLIHSAACAALFTLGLGGTAFAAAQLEFVSGNDIMFIANGGALVCTASNVVVACSTFGAAATNPATGSLSITATNFNGWSISTGTGASNSPVCTGTNGPNCINTSNINATNVGGAAVNTLFAYFADSGFTDLGSLTVGASSPGFTGSTATQTAYATTGVVNPLSSTSTTSPTAGAAQCGSALTITAGTTATALTTSCSDPNVPYSLELQTVMTTSAVGQGFIINGTISSANLPPPPSTCVPAPYQVRYASNLNIGDSYINITNTGANGAGLGSGTSAAVTGAICVNVYAFDPTEETVSCCSCPVTPNGLVSLSVDRDLISNPLFPRTPTSIVIKLVATAPVGGSCSGSALLAGTPTLACGLLAWGTTLHQNTSIAAATYALTEGRFSDATLSVAEQARLAYSCGIVANQGSGFGVCASCRLGGLGSVSIN